jgi:hypothetical protein
VDVERFRTAFAQTRERWAESLGAASARGRRVALWGAGSKAVAFLTTLAAGDEVAYAVDINPHKQGKYLAGTGHAVLGPADLADAPPDVVVAMNEIYEPEIRAMLDRLGLERTDLVTV